MAGAVVGIIVILLGLLIAPSGPLFLYAIYAIAGVIGLYFGIRGAAAAPTIGPLEGIPFAEELLYGLYIGAFSITLLGALIGVAGALVPAAYGFRLGTQWFGESLLAFVPALLGPVIGFVVLYIGFWGLSAVIGGMLVAVGVQFVFGLADSVPPLYTNIAEMLQTIGLPTIVSDVVLAIGAITQSGLLLAVAVTVTALGIVGHPMLVAAIE